MKNLKQALAFMLILTAFFACNDAKVAKTTFVMNGSLEGITDGKIMLSTRSAEGSTQDSAVIKDGKFVLKGDFPSTRQAYIQIEGVRGYKSIYVENAVMTLTGNVKEFGKASVTGCKAQDELNTYETQQALISEKYKDVRAEFYNKETSKDRKVELEKKLGERKTDFEALNERFIKENPTAFHSAVLVSRQLSGKSAAESKKVLNALPAELQKNPLIVKLLKDLAKKAEIEVSIDEMMANVNNVPYKVDEKFNGENLKDIIYLGLMSNNNVCALKKDGTVEIIDTKGKVLNTFKPEFNGQASSLAVDANDDIYLLCSVMEKVTKKVRGRSVERMMPKSVECSVFNVKGEKKAHYTCEGIITATGARVVDNNLVVADYRGAKLVMFDKTNGKVGPTMDGMRPCCGILDFSVNAKKEILVANLGAFRVQGFDFSGKSILEFGQRGKAVNDFHGCCNPVSVANLSTGAIVTVEKDPTRIKIYSKEGAKQIAGIEELVKGCSYIPMIVDSKDNLYLASGAKGMVKCVSIN